MYIIYQYALIIIIDLHINQSIVVSWYCNLKWFIVKKYVFEQLLTVDVNR